VVGIVSATTGIYDVKRTYIQEFDGGAWSGLAVWDNSGAFYAEEGEKVRVLGTVTETNGLTEIRVSSYIVFLGKYPIPDTIMVNTSDFAPGSPTAEQYESIFVQVISVSVTNDSLGDVDWLVDDGSGACRIDDEADYLYYDIPEIGTEITSITGILNYSNNNFKIEPRYRSDISDGDTSNFFTIPQLRQNISLLGDTVTVMGIVTAETGTFYSGQTFIEDMNGG
jgi:predicted extracellular nuclease